MQGSLLGPYRIDRELGAGGMGKVYAATAGEAARAVAPGVTIALKVVHPHLLETPGFFKRFLREAQVGQAVRHPNVVRTLECDSVVVDGQRFDYLAMEYVEGQTLRDLLVEMERVPEELCRHIGREVSKGLAAIHEAGVVHRDLKPENVLITPDHQIKVMDLGVARLMDEAVRLSQTGAFVGSLHYAAPEQFDGGGQDLDGRADLHALGLMLYELSTGQHPFLADSVPEIVRHVLRTEPRKVGQVHPQLSAFFEEAVQCLLAKDRDARFASATELFVALDGGEQSSWWRAKARSLQEETRRPIRRIRIPRETAVYGRDQELARLRGLFDLARSGDGQVALIEGEAGIGKSRLVDELIARLHADGEDVNFLFGSYPPGGAATASGAFSAAYRAQFGEAGSAAYLPDNRVLVPAFDALLRGEGTPESAQPLTSGSLQTCFVRATQAMASERVTVVLIDDLHFAPEEGRALFTSLAMGVPEHRVFLIGTARHGVPDEWRAGLTRLTHVTPLPVQRLGPKDLVRLLADSLGSERLAEDLAGKIAVKSDGNPFFVFEIIRGLREGQFITQRDDGTWATTRLIDEIQIPSSVLDLVNARVADLDEEERMLLDVACCWGFEFDPVVVGEVVGLGRIPLLRSLGQIERRHRLVRASGRGYVFDHHQVQEALYGSLSELLREEYHAALAEALETRTKAADAPPNDLDGALCVDLCEHFLRGARGASALRYLEPAQTHLSQGYLHDQMIALSERALSVPGLLGGTDRAGVLLRLADALDQLGHLARQEACAREAEQLAEEAADDGLRGRAAIALGGAFSGTSRHQEAEAAYRRAQQFARESGDLKAQAAAAVSLGNALYYQGRRLEAQEQHERHLELAREIGDRRGEAAAMGSLGTLSWAQGRLIEAQEHYERHLAIAREVGDRLGEATATGNLGLVFYYQGRLPEAREHHEKHLAIAREIGHRLGEANCTGNLGLALSSMGRISDAQERFVRTLAIRREIGDRRGEACALLYSGYVQRDLQEGDSSEEPLLGCLALCDDIGDAVVGSTAQLILGSLRARRSREAGGDGESGREALEAAREGARSIGVPFVDVLAGCELALLPGGDVEDALAVFAKHEERLRAEERCEARLLLFRATGDRTHLEEAKRLLDEALGKVPAEHHDSMCRNKYVHREILAAWREEFGDENGAPRGPNR